MMTSKVGFHKIFLKRVPRAGTSGHTHFGLEALCVSGEMLWCLSGRSHVFRTLWRVHRSWSLAIAAEFSLSVAVSAWLQNVPELSLLTLVSFHCPCDVKIVDRSLSTRYAKVYGIVHNGEPKTRRMTGHASQQHALLECLGLCLGHGERSVEHPVYQKWLDISLNSLKNVF